MVPKFSQSCVKVVLSARLTLIVGLPPRLTSFSEELLLKDSQGGTKKIVFFFRNSS